MNKLSPQEIAARNAANKAANKVRDRAFSQRRAGRRRERDAAESAARQSDAYNAYEAANRAFDEALNARRLVLETIDQKIAEMQQQRAELEASEQTKVIAARAAESAAFKEWKAVEHELLQQVDNKYPDMVNCNYVSVWTPTPEVLSAMEQAYNDALKDAGNA
ncbi:hypothetical protein [Cupriavidus metallidurans]|uniref:hypothetical protein n=1 Tax=Cupriavidus metallidurans TaxID=119219 RepID=UPI001CCF829D|nr:hypothetical protein [Cupriavidus metallidurans]UBM12800.1 hypothetical protein LAI70_28005 [Cupriavidus metallidurans]